MVGQEPKGLQPAAAIHWESGAMLRGHVSRGYVSARGRRKAQGVAQCSDTYVY
jgi:hypothetical protein